MEPYPNTKQYEVVQEQIIDFYAEVFGFCEIRYYPGRSTWQFINAESTAVLTTQNENDFKKLIGDPTASKLEVHFTIEVDEIEKYQGMMDERAQGPPRWRIPPYYDDRGRAIFAFTEDDSQPNPNSIALVLKKPED
jgi:hypothetical protein